MRNAASRAAVGQPVIARVLGKHDGIEKPLEKIVLDLIGVTRAETPSVSGCALPEGRVAVRRLGNSGIESGSKKCERVHGIVHEQDKFVFYFQGAEHGIRLIPWLARVRK